MAHPVKAAIEAARQRIADLEERVAGLADGVARSMRDVTDQACHARVVQHEVRSDHHELNAMHISLHDLLAANHGWYNDAYKQ